MDAAQIAAHHEGQLMTLAEFTERSAQLRALMETAREAEAVAYDKLKGIQQDMLQCITNDKHEQLERLEERYPEVEDSWRSCSLYTAELRAEMQDLIKERHGELAAEPALAGATAHSKSAQAMQAAQLSTHGHALSLTRAKPARIAVDDVSPQRRPLVKEAFPDVDPRFANDERLPIGDAQLRTEFERLDTAQCGELTIPQTVAYFESHEQLGVPINVPVWVVRHLARHKPKLRTAAMKKDTSLVDNAETVTFDEFAYLMLCWAQN